MGKYIRAIQTIVLTVIILQCTAYPADTGIGKIVKKIGITKKTNISCESADCRQDANIIYPGDRIITGIKSEVSVILNDGTAIMIYEKSDTIFYGITNKKNKTLTSIYSDYGKFKIIQQNDFLDASLVFKSRTAMIMSVCSTIDIITGNSETGIFVYKGEAGFANIDPSISDAYVVKTGYESFLKKSTIPTVPHEVKATLRSSWLKRHYLTRDNDRIIRYDKKNGPVDWFFIEKK